MIDFFKFPRTPHLFVVAGLEIRDDKVFSERECDSFLNNTIILEEKVDGANIGISLSNSGELLIQNRGNYIFPASHPQFRLFEDWTYSRLALFQKYVSSDFIVFGEWCYAKHSIQYTSLPDWFLGFDVYDKKNKVFLNCEQRNHLLEKINIEIIPRFGKDKYSKPDLEKLLDQLKSNFYSGSVEGIYLRLEDSEKLVKRAKIVNKQFIQGIKEHWSKQELTINKISKYNENDHRTL